MRHDHRVKAGGIHRWGLPIAFAKLLGTLKESAIDQNPLLAMGEEVPGAGYRAGCP
jgi:hypothetical protein